MSHKKLIMYSPYGNTTVNNTPIRFEDNIMVDGSYIPIYPKIQSKSQPNIAEDRISTMQHFMLETIVETPDAFVQCSMRYQTVIDGKNSLAEVFQDFYNQFVEKCDEVKLKYITDQSADKDLEK